MANGAIASEQLRLLIERIERLEEEKKGIADDIRDVFLEAKSHGFDVKTMKAIIKLRAMDPHARREAEALLDTYKAALGMLDGTPLGRWALERLEKEDKEAAAKKPDAEDQAPGDATPDDEAKPAEPPAPEPTVEEAREMGKAAAAEGKPVTANPFPARDLRRAAWDEAWCMSLGSDGMDIPDALKPTPKKKDPKPDAAPDDGESGSDGE